MNSPQDSNRARPVVILGGLRTPWAKAGTALAGVHAAELARIPAEELLLRLGVPVSEVDEVVLGNVAQPADAANIARVVALRLGLPISTPALTVQRNCASGMEAISQAFDKVRFGLADLVLAGGTESMSNIPILFPPSYQKKLMKLGRSRTVGARAVAVAAFRPGDWKPVYGIEEGLTDPVCGQNMGETAENLAREHGISREEQDAYALESHARAIRAQDEGFFDGEVVPVLAPPDYETVKDDVGPRRGQTLEALAKLKPYFDRRLGTVTVGNSCPITDGGCALLIASEEKARELGKKPLGWILSYSYRGCPPDRMGLGPAFAAPEALDRAGLTLPDMDRIELNEAFAVQVLANQIVFESEEFARRELGRTQAVGRLDPSRLNVNGGAIATGHPVGATGARLVLTLLRELERKDLKRGLATLCIGGGQGAAMVVERR
ncbi:MAG TPA: thiolase family protein [Planctomycetota bacterium]|nr:thiolase family protein [Planctomycetota bacterium]